MQIHGRQAVDSQQGCRYETSGGKAGESAVSVDTVPSPSNRRQSHPCGFADGFGHRAVDQVAPPSRLLVAHREDPLATGMIVELLGN